MIEFRHDCIPPTVTAQGAGTRITVRGGKPRVYKDAKAKGSIADLTSICHPHRPTSPLPGPLEVHLEFAWPWRKSETKRLRGMGRLPMTSRPDCDNLAKQICDVMTKLQFWNDDSQVYHLTISKFWADRPGIKVSIKEVAEA